VCLWASRVKRWPSALVCVATQSAMGNVEPRYSWRDVRAPMPPSATKSSGSSVPSCSNLLIVFSTSWKSRAGHVTVERARLDLYLTATCNRDRGDAELAIWKSTSLGAFRYSDRAPITSARSRRPTRGNRSCDRGPIRSPARSSVSVLAPLPREYLVFGDIEGKLDVLRVECTKCSRRGV
jgi:hypothetical protein